MRSDFLSRLKSVHISMLKERHLAFRTELLKHNIGMQETFNVMAEHFINDEAFRNRIVRKVIQYRIDASERRAKREEFVGTLDAETMYDLIEASEEETTP